MPSTTFKGYTAPTFNSEIGTWGADIVSNFTSVVDLNVGGQISVSLASTTPLALTTGSTGQIQSSIISYTGTILANIATTSANQGFNLVENRTTGSFSVTYQSNFGSGGVGAAWTIPQGFSGLFFNDTTYGARSISWVPSLLLSQSGAQPLSVRRTENVASTSYKAVSIQSGAGSGNDYGIYETGDGSGNVTTVTEQIGSTALAVKTTTSYGFPIPVSLTEVSTPSAPSSGIMQLYAVSGNFIASQTPGGVQRVYGKDPTVQPFLSGSGTATPSAGVVRWEVVMCGGGAGGQANFSGALGSNGGQTSLGGWTANGGGSPAGGSGGSNGTGTLIDRIPGGSGVGSTNATTNMAIAGAPGGANPRGGAGAGTGSTGGNGAANTGAGGAGAGIGTNNFNGAGGGAGEWVSFYISAPTAMSYAVGAGGGGASNAGNGAAGVIIIKEFYS